MNCVQTSPRLAGQTRIVAEEERRLSGVRNWRRWCPQTASATRPRQSILKKAFTGDLPA